MSGPDLHYQKREDVEREYRSANAAELLKFRVVVGESDLWILANLDLQPTVEDLLKRYRRQLKEYIYHHPVFKETFSPYPRDEHAPKLIQWMIDSSAKVNVGPMAAVAGAIAGIIGLEIDTGVTELIIENGGDIYLRSSKERTISVHAGKSVFSGKIGLVIPPQPLGLGICTSAGTVGPSVSLGKADAVVIISPDTALADSTATATGNLIQDASDLSKAIDFAKSIPEIRGVLLIKDDKMAAWGEIEVAPT
jgi:ApbE superfamily uncharacterized protein (UPF0280 family)